MGLLLEKPIKMEPLCEIGKHEVRCFLCGTHFLWNDKSFLKPCCPYCNEIQE